MRAIVIAAAVLLHSGCRPISFPGPGLADFEAPLPGGYKLYRSSAHQITVLPSDRGIPPKVVEVGYDDDFIIAKQNHLRRRSPGNSKDTSEEPDPGVFSFWIIDLRKSESYGPLTEDEFAAKRNDLAVSQSVMLRDVYDYKP
jgi:hypothetical protein